GCTKGRGGFGALAGRRSRSWYSRGREQVGASACRRAAVTGGVADGANRTITGGGDEGAGVRRGSAGAAGEGDAVAGRAEPAVHHSEGAGTRHRFEEVDQRRPGRPAGSAPDGDRADR